MNYQDEININCVFREIERKKEKQGINMFACARKPDIKSQNQKRCKICR